MKLLIVLVSLSLAYALPQQIKMSNIELPVSYSGVGEDTILDLAQTLKLTKLFKLISKLNFQETLFVQGPFTLFAPTDDAFAKLSSYSLRRLENDYELLTDVLLYHVAGTEIYSDKMKNEELVKSRLGSAQVRINIYDKVITVNGCPISKPDQAVPNGVIHLIDYVMFPIPNGDIPSVVASHFDFATLLEAVRVAGLTETLEGDSQTLLAPTNAAFHKLPFDTLKRIMGDKEMLTKVVENHLIKGTVFSVALQNGGQVTTTLNNKLPISIDADSGEIKIGQATVIYPDETTTNGVVHVIDTVLLPPSLDAMTSELSLENSADALKIKTLLDMISKLNFQETLFVQGPFTLFAPSDDAFKALHPYDLHRLQYDNELLTDVLLYHISGTKMSSDQFSNEQLVPSRLGSTEIRVNVYDEVIAVNGCPISKPDQIVSKGVVHVIDYVMYPIPIGDIPYMVASNFEFSTLLEAARVAGLMEKLEGGPYTLLAPTNAAFRKLPYDTLKTLMGNNDMLTKVIKNHMIDGTMFHVALKDGEEITTVNGDKLPVTIGPNGETKIGEAALDFYDVTVTNGVLHVIDTVLIPKDLHVHMVRPIEE